MTTFVRIWAIISSSGLTSGTAPFVTQEAPRGGSRDLEERGPQLGRRHLGHGCLHPRHHPRGRLLAMAKKLKIMPPRGDRREGGRLTRRPYDRVVVDQSRIGAQFELVPTRMTDHRSPSGNNWGCSDAVVDATGSWAGRQRTSMRCRRRAGFCGTPRSIRAPATMWRSATPLRSTP